jgi:cytidylate kinase
MIITIDGPSASGKSTIAGALADQLRMCHISTGMFYRGLAYVLLYKKAYTLETLAHAQEADIKDVLDPQKFVAQYRPETDLRIFFEGIDITPCLKTPEIDQASSIIGTNKIARDYLLKVQQDCSIYYDIVVEGRDTGSVVFPHADIKFYLTARDEVRARRLQNEFKKRGIEISEEDALHSIRQRDNRDRERNVSPLTIPQGATIIDNSDMDVNQTVQAMMRVINDKRS